MKLNDARKIVDESMTAAREVVAESMTTVPTSEVAKLPVGTIVCPVVGGKPVSDFLVVVADGVIPRSLVPPRAGEYEVPGEPAAQWGHSTWAVVHRGSGRVLTKATVDSTIMTWWKKALSEATVRVGTADPATLTPAQLNRELDLLDQEGTRLNDAMLAAGRDERGSEVRAKAARGGDPLAQAIVAVWDRATKLRDEIATRYGPGAPRRLPPGFKRRR
jgi:hypothetical protein